MSTTEAPSAGDLFDSGGADLNALCARVTIIEVIAKALCASMRIPWDQDEWENNEGDCGELDDEATAVFDAVFDAGLIRPEWYGYDEDTRKTVALPLAGV